MRGEREWNHRPPSNRQTCGARAENECDERVRNDRKRRKKNGCGSDGEKRAHLRRECAALPCLHAITPALFEICSRKCATSMRDTNAVVIDDATALHELLDERRVFADVSNRFVEAGE